MTNTMRRRGWTRYDLNTEGGNEVGGGGKLYNVGVSRSFFRGRESVGRRGGAMRGITG